MRSQIFIIVSMVVMFTLTGCASTNIKNQQVSFGQLPKPAHIWVYSLAATPQDLPANSTLAGMYAKDAPLQTAEQIATGRKLGAQIQAELIKQIVEMGLPAEFGFPQTSPAINDIVLRGAIVSFDEGSAAKRVGIGLGSGSSELKVALEGFQVTDHGLRMLGSGSSDSAGGKTPGAAVGAAAFIATANPAGLIVSTGMKVYGESSGKSKIEGRAEQTAKEIAELLKKRFKEQGWI